MNKKIIHLSKEYVNMLLWPLENHYYHHYEHSLDVMERSIELWIKEWLDEDTLEILALAWIFHDVWFIIQYDNNEYIWASIAKNYLKWILYDDEKIKSIEKLIIATIPDRTPQNLLENIIRDADTDNLWRDDFFDKWWKLKKELETIKNIKIKDPDWMHYSLRFLKEHKYKTKTEIIERQEKKEENIKTLEKMIL